MNTETTAPTRLTIEQTVELQEKEHYGPREDEIHRVLSKAEAERQKAKGKLAITTWRE